MCSELIALDVLLDKSKGFKVKMVEIDELNGLILSLWHG